MTWADVRKELDRIATLADGWDGVGGPAPHLDAISMTRVVMRGLEVLACDPPVRIHLTVNGAILMEWHHPDRYTQIEAFHDPRRGVVVETREVGR